MPIIDTSLLGTDNAPSLSSFENHQIYCGLDSCVTLEVLEKLDSQFSRPNWSIYDFELALQAPYLEIMQRGFAVDIASRQRAIASLRLRIEELSKQLNEFASAIWDKPLNPRSPQQLQEFFYKAMRLPEVWISQKGVRKLSTNREVLEKLDQYIFARPVIQTILRIRDLAKQLEVFETEIDSDGRLRCSYNIAGTESGRPSSSPNAFGTGRNMQNVAPSLRYVFTADPSMKLCVIDLEQVEARDVGFFIGCLFDDWTFLDNCESGDLHTNNCKLIWPHLPWTDEKVQDKKLAETPFYRDFSHRDMAKRGGHLSNYMGTAYTAARHLKVPQAIMDEFQARYCRGGIINGRRIEPAFPGIPRYWQWCAEQLQTRGYITTPFGRQRHFFGRPGDDTTLREAIAFLPQSTTADRMNLGLWRVWKADIVQLLAQTYDSITFQYPPEIENEVIPQILELIKVELIAPNGRRYTVPGEAKVGWNWGYYHENNNPKGLRKWKPAN